LPEKFTIVDHASDFSTDRADATFCPDIRDGQVNSVLRSLQAAGDEADRPRRRLVRHPIHDDHVAANAIAILNLKNRGVSNVGMKWDAAD